MSRVVKSSFFLMYHVLRSETNKSNDKHILLLHSRLITFYFSGGLKQNKWGFNVSEILYFRGLTGICACFSKLASMEIVTLHPLKWDVIQWKTFVVKQHKQPPEVTKYLSDTLAIHSSNCIYLLKFRLASMVIYSWAPINLCVICF